MAKFHSLKVSDIKKETSDSVSVAFEVPAPLKPEYLFKHGQYITLKLMVDGKEVRRSYSICTSPYSENELRIVAKEVKGGVGSVFINKNLKKGDAMEVMTPMGNFTSPLSGSVKKHYVLYAGGSGITPIMSILKSILYIEKQSTVTLYYANRNEDTVIFRDQLNDIAAKNTDRVKIVNIYDSPLNGSDELYKGLLSKEKVKALLAKHENLNAVSEIFICGPGPMMENIKDALSESKVPAEKIHIEYFSAVLDTLAAAEGKDEGGGENVNAEITVLQYGTETKFKLNTKGSSILDAALDAGVDVPFSCKGAVCCTCRAKVLEGKVKMDANFALTDGEVAQGFVLTCQSHPLTAKVVVDYDAT
ncbi:MAG: 2Fe-2S iron-sulfur cluster binding domain-containing protein [Bacteroidia bacterium]|nr:2Fe-2S iron-sulfur cluster binding domain-containing protein [Bacteroidia bacterium]